VFTIPLCRVVVATRRRDFRIVRSETLHFDALEASLVALGDRARARCGDVAALVTVLPNSRDSLAAPLHVVSAQLSGQTGESGGKVRAWQAQYLARQLELFTMDMPAPLVVGVSANCTPRTAPYHILRSGRLPDSPQPPAPPFRPAAIPLSCSSARVSWLPLTRAAEGDAPVTRYRLQALVVPPYQHTLTGLAKVHQAAVGDDSHTVDEMWTFASEVSAEEDDGGLEGEARGRPKRGEDDVHTIVSGRVQSVVDVGAAARVNAGEIGPPGTGLAGRAGPLASLDPGMSSVQSRVGGKLHAHVREMGGGQNYRDVAVIAATATVPLDPEHPPSDTLDLSLANLAVVETEAPRRRRPVRGDGALAPSTLADRGGAGYDGMVTAVVTGLASGALYQFRVIAVSAIGESEPSLPSLLIQTPSSVEMAARQSLMARELNVRGIDSSTVHPAELRSLGALGAADQLAEVRRNAMLRPAGRTGAVFGPKTAEGVSDGSMVRPRLEASDTWEPAPPGGKELWGNSPDKRRQVQDDIEQQRIDTAMASYQRAQAVTNAVDQATRDGSMGATEGMALKALVGVRERDRRLVKQAQEAEESSEDGGESFADADIDSGRSLSPTHSIGHPDRLAELVPDSVDAWSKVVQERAAANSAQGSHPEGMTSTGFGWKRAQYAMSGEDSKTEAEMSMAQTHAIESRDVRRGGESTLPPPTLSDDLRSAGATAKAAVRIAAESGISEEGEWLGEAYKPLPSHTGADSIALAPGAASHRLDRLLPVPSEWTDLPMVGKDARAAVRRKTSPDDPDMAGLPVQKDTIYDDGVGGLTPRDEEGISVHGCPLSMMKDGDSFAFESGQPRGSSSRWERGVDSTAEEFAWRRRAVRRAHRLQLASAYERYRYLLPLEDPDSLNISNGFGGNLLEFGAQQEPSEDEDASDAGSFDVSPPSTHRAVRLGDEEDADDLDVEAFDPPLNKSVGVKLPGGTTGLGTAVVPGQRLSPAQHKQLRETDATVRLALESQVDWEPVLGQGEPRMTLLAPLGAPGSDSIDDTPCVPIERSDTAAARRDALAMNQHPVAPEYDDYEEDDEEEEDERFQDDGAVRVACVDYIFYSSNSLVLSKMARLPCSLLPDEVPDPLTVLEAEDGDILPNSVRASHHLSLFAAFRLLRNAQAMTLH
jgi:hypothetical protein